MKALRYRFEAGLAYVLYGLFRILPVGLASACGGALARWLGPFSRAHKTAATNLALALPDIDDTSRSAVLREVWDNLGRTMAEYATLSRLWGSRTSDRIEVEGAEHITRLVESNSPAIIFSGHIGNWETLPLVTSKIATPPAVVYRAPNNPFVESLLQTARGVSASLQIPKGQNGARDIIRHLRKGGFVGMLVDQKSNTGLAVPLFGRDAMTGDAVARIALRTKCPIVPARVERVGGCHFKVVFDEPWILENGEDKEADVRNLLARMNERLEHWIKERPGQWLWPHNRWPKDNTSS